MRRQARPSPIRSSTHPIQRSNPVAPAIGAAGQPTQHWHRPQTTHPRSHKVDSIPIGAASAANAGGLVQTPQSKVPRPELRGCPGRLCRGTSDWVIAFVGSNAGTGPTRATGAYTRPFRVPSVFHSNMPAASLSRGMGLLPGRSSQTGTRPGVGAVLSEWRMIQDQSPADGSAGYCCGKPPYPANPSGVSA